MSIVIEICAIAGVGVLAILLLRKTSAELSYAATIATVIVLGFAASGVIVSALSFIYELTSFAGIDSKLIQPLIKCIGISVVTKLGCDMCRDSGVNTAATYIELVGGIIAVMIAAPLMMSVLKGISG